MADILALIYLPKALRDTASDLLGVDESGQEFCGAYKIDDSRVSSCLQEVHARVIPDGAMFAVCVDDANTRAIIHAPHHQYNMLLTAWSRDLLRMMACVNRFYRERLCVVCEYDVLSEGGRHAHDCPVQYLDGNRS